MKSRFDAALRLLSAVVPAALAAAGGGLVPLAAHDRGVLRTVGAGFTGPFRALDLLVASPAILLPIGTRALRAGLASAVVTGICGALAFDIARSLVATVVPAVLQRGLPRPGAKVSPRLVSAVAAVSVLTALLSPAWQAEASAPGGAVLGALLVLLASRLVVPCDDESVAAPRTDLGSMALLAGLAASYEPLVFASVVAALAPRVVSLVIAREKPKLDGRAWLAVALAFGLGLLPLAVGVAVARRSPEIALATPGALFERAASPLSLGAAASAEIGTLLLVTCLVGAILSVITPAARAVAASLVLVVATAALATALRAPAGPTQFAAPVLAGILAAFILGATALGAIVLAIARARVPFAEASAALVVVLELVLPVRAIDETMSRRDGHASHAAAIWNDVAWGAAPPAAVVLVADRSTMDRIASARATGEMRGDLVVVPAYDVQGRAGQRALFAEPKLAALYRDMALGIAPEELSLAQLGAQRAVLSTFDPKWDRALSRHLVPLGLSSRFEPEPRGTSDRKGAMDAFAPLKDRLVRVVVAKRDAELAAATAVLLRRRAIAMAATGEREMLARALDELRAFAPDDPVSTTLVRRTVTSKGPIEVRDLAP